MVQMTGPKKEHCSNWLEGDDEGDSDGEVEGSVDGSDDGSEEGALLTLRLLEGDEEG